MAFIELRANESLGGRRGGRIADTTASTMALHKSGNRNGVPTYQLSIRLAQDLVKQMRWQIGDRVKVLVDDETPHKLLLQRVTSGGWALSYAGGKTQTVKKYRVQTTSYTGINVAPGDRYVCNGFTEEHGGAVLQFAKVAE